LRSERRFTNVEKWPAPAPPRALKVATASQSKERGSGATETSQSSSRPLDAMELEGAFRSAPRPLQIRSPNPKETARRYCWGCGGGVPGGDHAGSGCALARPLLVRRTAGGVPPYRLRKSAPCSRAGALDRQRPPPRTQGPRRSEALPRTATEPGVASVAGVERLAGLA